ncbi:hypothetical protein MBLNU230_g5730t1 [Neophaeotheca triangularis]
MLNPCGTTAYGFNPYFPILVTGLGIVEDDTLALFSTSPPYVLGAIVAATIAWNSDRNQERGYHVAISLSAAAVGFAMSVSSNRHSCPLRVLLFPRGRGVCGQRAHLLVLMGYELAEAREGETGSWWRDC